MAYVVLSIGLGFFILFLVSLAFPVHFKLDFSDGKSIVTIRRQSVLLPFTYYGIKYEDLQRAQVFSTDSVLSKRHTLKVYHAELVFPKKRRVVFSDYSRKEIVKYVSQINIALSKTEPYELTKGNFLYEFILWFKSLSQLNKMCFLIFILLLISPLLYMIITHYAVRPQHSNYASLLVVCDFVFRILLPFPVICSILSLGINFFIKKKKSTDIVNNKLKNNNNDSSSDANSIYDSIIK